jgi:hypothetical protein
LKKGLEMTGVFAAAVMNYLTLVTVVVCMFLPSLWVSAGVGVTVAMIGVLFYVGVEPNSQIVGSWLVAQTLVALATNLMRKSWR